MSADGKPLHVRVAEALGCHLAQFDRDEASIKRGLAPVAWTCACSERRTGTGVGLHGAGVGVLRYDTDWSATGPLIEKYGITVQKDYHDAMWYAHYRYNTSFRLDDPWEEDEGYGDGPTPLIAVCNLILALKEAGKL